jgi:hypothetical protein
VPSVSELWSVKEHTRSLHENVKFAVGAEFDGPFESPPQAASSTAPRATVRTGEKRIVLVSSPRVKVRCGKGTNPCCTFDRPGKCQTCAIWGVLKLSTAVTRTNVEGVRT